MKSLKIVVISTLDYGGAGKAAYRLHKGLLSNGIHSTMIAANKKSGDSTVKVLPTYYTASKTKCIDVESYISPVWNSQYSKWQKMLSEYLRRPEGLEFFTDAESTVRLQQIEEIQEADIIHLHWVAGVMDYPTAPSFISGKPVVWTLHDMNPFTGGCHYAGTCIKYKKSCGACPQLGSDNPDDLAKRIWQQKQNAYKNIQLNLVTPSRWLAQRASESSLLYRFPVDVIPYGLPVDIFRPLPKNDLRKAFNIDQKTKIILFGADSIGNERKGFHYLAEAMRKLHASVQQHNIAIAFFGHVPKTAKIALPYPVINFGSVASEEQLAIIYNIADVFVLPSLEDNLPNTVLEAIACGVPVVGFNIGGMPDMIEHEKTGCLVSKQDIQGLSDAIEWIVYSPKIIAAQLSENCRQKALKHYSPEIQARAYANVYDQLMNTSKPYTPLCTDTFDMSITGGDSMEGKTVINGAGEKASCMSYSKKSHVAYLKQYEATLFKKCLDPVLWDLKRYQDLLVLSFIRENIPAGAKILEVGGGDSRIIKYFKNDYECWNIDKLEGVGTGPKKVTAEGYRLIRDYMGNFNKELPDNYFDFVFSISALEHSGDDAVVHQNIAKDINRVLMPGGLSLHCFDIVITKENVWANNLLLYLFETEKTINPFIPFDRMKEDPDLYVMSKEAFEKGWDKVTKKTYAEFGMPLSYNILWQKELPAQSAVYQNHTIIHKHKELPVISLVTPSYNQVDLLEECIDSVLSQKYPKLEYIVMDGGSTDGSVEVIKKYEKYITFWQSKPDQGQYWAIHEGFKKTTGEIMCWLNSDDKYHQDAFQQIADIFNAHFSVEWITGRPTVWDDAGKLTRIFNNLPMWSRQDYLEGKYKKCCIQQESTFWRRSLWGKAGAYIRTDMKYAGDFELWIRFFRYAQLYTVDALLGGFRYHHGQKTDCLDKYFAEAEKVVLEEKIMITRGKHNNCPPPPPVITIHSVKAHDNPDKHINDIIKEYICEHKRSIDFSQEFEQELLCALKNPIQYLAGLEGPLYTNCHRGKLVKKIMLSDAGKAVRTLLPKFNPFCERYFPRMMLNILSDGSVTTCCFDPYGANTFSSIHMKEFKDIWEQDVPAVMRGDFYANKRCRVCAGQQGWYVSLINVAGEKEKWLECINKKPNEVQIEIASACNYKCVSCYSPKLISKRQPFLDLDKTFHNIKEYLPLITKLNLYNHGEPLLHPDFASFAMKCRGAAPGIVLEIATNGMLLSEDISRKIIEAKVDRIIISAHGGPGTENMLRYSQRGADYEKLITNIQTLIKLRKAYTSLLPKISLRTILFEWNDNEETMDRLRSDAKKLGLYATWGHYDTDNYHWYFDGVKETNIYSKRFIAGSDESQQLLEKRELFSPGIYEKVISECCQDANSACNKKDIKIYTSISPHDIENQQRSIRSWQKAGFCVISLNSGEELCEIRNHFPNVLFKPVLRDARSEYGKPLVYIDDILKACSQEPDSICGIINSDITLEGITADKIIEATKGALVFGSRMDIKEHADMSGATVFKEGFDYFFIDSSLTSVFPSTHYCLGMPWWDYFLPLYAFFSGITIKKINYPIGKHIRHQYYYDHDRWRQSGLDLLQYLLSLVKPQGSDTKKAHDIWAEDIQNHINAYIEKKKSKKASLESLDPRTLVGLFAAHSLNFLDKYAVEIEAGYVLNVQKQNNRKNDDVNLDNRTQKSITAPLNSCEEAKWHNSKGEEYFAEDRWEEAKSAFERALEINRNYVPSLNNLGVLAWNSKDYKKAEIYLSKALQVDPDDPTALLNYNEVCKVKGTQDIGSDTDKMLNCMTQEREGSKRSPRIIENENNQWINDAFLEKQREFWNMDTMEKAMFQRIYADAQVHRLTDEEKKSAWKESASSSVKQILQGIPYRSEWKVLEIGCGVGRLIKPMREMFAQVDGVDIAENMIRFAKTYLADGRQNGSALVNNGHDVHELPDRAYDLVFSMIVFQHIHSLSVVRSYFRDIYRVLKPGGYFRIQVHEAKTCGYGSFDEEADPDTQYGFLGNGYTKEQLQSLLEESGFVADEVTSASIWIWATVHRPESAAQDKITAAAQERCCAQQQGGVRCAAAEQAHQYLVSAIVSAYNSEKFIQGCLEDLTAQTLYKENRLEIIVVNSGSLQNEEAIVKSFQQDHAHIIYVKTERESLYESWNRGIKIARGKYITNANTDDRHRKDAFDVLSRTLEQRADIDLVYADCYVSSAANETFDENMKNRLYRYPEFFPPASLLYFQFGPQPMWRKSVHDKTGYFDGSYRAAGDHEFSIRFAMNCRALHVSEALGLYLEHPDAITFKDKTVSHEDRRISRVHRTPGVIRKLYEAAGIAAESAQDMAKVFVDIGNRALGFYPPWRYGEERQNIDLARKCFAWAKEAAPDWIVPCNNLSIALDIEGKGEKAQGVEKRKLLESGLALPPQRELDLPASREEETVPAETTGICSSAMARLPGKPRMLFYYRNLHNSTKAFAGSSSAVINIAGYLKKYYDADIVLCGKYVDHEESYGGLQLQRLPDSGRLQEFCGAFDVVLFGTHLDEFKGIEKRSHQTWILHQHCWNVEPAELRRINTFDMVICLSAVHEVHAVEQGVPPASVVTLPNVLDAGIFYPRNAQRDPYSIMFAGAIVPHKGVHLLIEAFRIVQKRYPRATLHVYGSAAMWRDPGAYEEQLKGLNIPGVRFYGSIPNKDMPDIYSQHSLYCLPSRLESFGLGTIEAQACGCIPVVHDAGGVSATLLPDATGFLYATNTAEALARKIEEAFGKLAENPKIRDAAVRFAHDRFNAARIAGKYYAAVMRAHAKQGIKHAAAGARGAETDAMMAKVAVTPPKGSKTGIIVFGHTRPMLLENLLESLKRQGATENVHVWLDGHHGRPALKDKVEACRTLVKAKYPLAKLTALHGNIGIEKMTIDGLSFMSQRYDNIIILEDDCFPTAHAIAEFERALDEVKDRPEVYSVYGHYFLTPSEGDTITRFQGWGWATTRQKLLPVLEEIKRVFMLTEPEYLEWAGKNLTPEVVQRLDVTPGRNCVTTIARHFCWDGATCLITAMCKLVHQKTSRRVIYNCGMGEESMHFSGKDICRKPPLNMILPNEVWNYFDGGTAADARAGVAAGAVRSSAQRKSGNVPETLTVDGLTFSNVQRTKHKNTSVGFHDRYVLKIEHFKHSLKLRSLSEEIEIIKYLNNQECASCPTLYSEGRLPGGEPYYVMQRLYGTSDVPAADKVLAMLEQKSFGVCQNDFKKENFIQCDNGCCSIIDYDQAVLDERLPHMNNSEFFEWYARYYVDRWQDYGDPDFYRTLKSSREEVAGLFSGPAFNLAAATLFKEQRTTNSKCGIYHSLKTPALYIDGARGLDSRTAALDSIHFRCGERVLDVGCNMGLLSHYLYDRGCSVTGIDMDPKIIIGAKMVANILHKKIVFRHQDLDAQCIREQYDTVCLFSVIHHVKNFKEVTENIMQSCSRVIFECALKETGFKPVDGKWTGTTKWQFGSVDELVSFLRGVLKGFEFEKYYGSVDRDRHILAMVKKPAHKVIDAKNLLGSHECYEPGALYA